MSLRVGNMSRDQVMETLLNLAEQGRVYLVNTGEPFKCFKLSSSVVRFDFRRLTLVASAEEEIKRVILEQGGSLRLLGYIVWHQIVRTELGWRQQRWKTQI